MVAHVGAIAGLQPIRDPEKTEEPHDVVDAKGAAVRNDLANTRAVQTVSAIAMDTCVGRRETPILSIRRKIVRRRAYAAAVDKEFSMRPQFCAATVSSDCVSVIQDRHH